jgi:hypothetical protein
VENRRWLVRGNLVKALRHLRYPDRERVLWIDALSINQGNSPEALREREHQIRLMKHVYSIAGHVIVWMGVPDNELAEFIREYLTGSKSLVSSLKPEDARLILFIFRIQQFDWWKRLWVLQEVALASSVTAYFANICVSFDRLLNELSLVKDLLRNFIDGHGDSIIWQITALSLQSSLSINPGIFHELRQLSSCYEIKIQSRIQTRKDHVQNKNVGVNTQKIFQDFANCVVRFRYHRTSIPLDKLYSLLGLFPDLVGNELAPRYDEDVACMYARSTIHIIRSSGSLYLLSQAQIPFNSVPTYAASLPSWVPDWTASPHQGTEWLCAPYRESREKLFDASSGARCIVQRRDGNQTLGLRGVMIDVISSCHNYSETHLPITFEEWWDQTQGWRKLAGVYQMQGIPRSENEVGSNVRDPHLQQNSKDCEEIAAIYNNDYIGGGKRNQAYWRTLMQGCGPALDRPESPRRPISYSLSYKQPDNRLHSTFLRKLSLCSEGDLEMCNFFSQSPRPLENVNPNPLLSHLRLTLARQTFFVTDDGFIGMSPAKLEPGDQVWVLAGGSHPFVLREDKLQRGYYKLIGETYVDGIMLYGDINKPYASRRTREQLNTGSGHQDLGHNSDVWEEVWLR